VSAVDAGIDQVRHLALIVHEETLGRAAGRIRAAPDAIAILITDCLRTFERFAAFELRRVGAQIGGEVARDFVNDLASAVDQVFAGRQALNYRQRTT
jgi:hypothetical protein